MSSVVATQGQGTALLSGTCRPLKPTNTEGRTTLGEWKEDVLRVLSAHATSPAKTAILAGSEMTAAHAPRPTAFDVDEHGPIFSRRSEERESEDYNLLDARGASDLRKAIRTAIKLEETHEKLSRSILRDVMLSTITRESMDLIAADPLYKAHPSDPASIYKAAGTTHVEKEKHLRVVHVADLMDPKRHRETADEKSFADSTMRSLIKDVVTAVKELQVAHGNTITYDELGVMAVLKGVHPSRQPHIELLRQTGKITDATDLEALSLLLCAHAKN